MVAGRVTPDAADWMPPWPAWRYVPAAQSADERNAPNRLPFPTSTGIPGMVWRFLIARSPWEAIRPGEASDRP